MFGYLVPNLNELSEKEKALWLTYHCGMCYSFKQFGQSVRICATYDFAFLNNFLHSYLGVIPEFDEKRCAYSGFKKIPFVKLDNISTNIAEKGILLMYYQKLDNVFDKEKSSIKIGRLILKKAYNKAKEKNFELGKKLKELIEKQAILEENQESNLNKISAISGHILQSVVDELIKDKPNKNVSLLFFNIGKWVYLLDAIDDLKSDHKHKKYNPLLIGKNFQGDKRQFMHMHKNQFEPIFQELVNKMGKCYSLLKKEQQDSISHNVIVTTPQIFVEKMFK